MLFCSEAENLRRLLEVMVELEAVDEDVHRFWDRGDILNDF